MTGFDMFLDRNIPDGYDYLRSMLCREEGAFLKSIRELVKSGANLSRLLQHRDKADMAFISAYRTGKDSARGGYAYYSDGDVDSLGNTHKSGDKVSHKENQRQNRSLGMEISHLGYGFVKIAGFYEAPEDSFCVLNYAEDTEQFIQDMGELAKMYKQDSVLIVPKDAVPFFYYPSKGRRDYAKDDSIHVLADSVDTYFSKIQGHKFNFNLSGLALVPTAWSDDGSLIPIRSGMPCLFPVGSRKELRSRSVPKWRNMSIL